MAVSVKQNNVNNDKVEKILNGVALWASYWRSN